MAPARRLQDAFAAFAQDLIDTHGSSKERLHAIIDSLPDAIAAGTFDTELTPLETLSRHLEDREDASQLLERQPGTLERALKSSYEKHPGPLPPSKGPLVPMSVFSQGVPALEALCSRLRRDGLRNQEIAELIGKDERVVATALSRARKRGGADA